MAFSSMASSGTMAAHSASATAMPAPSDAASSVHPSRRGAEWKRCFVAIGSNAGHRARHLNEALRLLRHASPAALTLEATSFLYESTPVGSPPEHASQPRFLNAVIELSTTLEPLPLLDLLKNIEQSMGRDANMVRNGPRVIDLDILMYGSPAFHLSHPRLEVPHPRWSSRGFVIIPLKDLVSTGSDAAATSPEQHAWIDVVNDAHRSWQQVEADKLKASTAAGTPPELESIYRVIPFPSVQCVPDSPVPALSDVWRWGRSHAAVAVEQSAAATPQVEAPTLLMGILNVTPDSFSDGGVNMRDGVQGAVDAAKRLWDAGADIIDIGGESTRPGSSPVSAAEELRRVLPVIDALQQQHPFIKLSIDTYHPSVARSSVYHGVVMINDVYGGTFREATAAGGSECMLDVAAELNVPYVCMHMRGTAQDMTQRAAYNDVVTEVLNEQVAQCTAALQPRVASPASSSADAAPRALLYRWNLIADPGIGFAKTPAHSLQLLNQLPSVRPLDLPLLLGTSRKGFISRVLAAGDHIGEQRQLAPGTRTSSAVLSPPPAVSSEAREWGTAATVSASILGGASIVRVHDVKAMRAVRDVTDQIARK